MIDRYELRGLGIVGADPAAILGTVKIVAARCPTRQLLEKLVLSSRLPYYTDFVCRIVLAYPWRMGLQQNDRSLILTSEILVEEPGSDLVLPKAVVAYAEAIDDDERRRGKVCRRYVPHMENWLLTGPWRELGADTPPQRSTMDATERAYEAIKRARGS